MLSLSLSLLPYTLDRWFSSKEAGCGIRYIPFLSGMWKPTTLLFRAGGKKASMLCESALSFCDDGQELTELHEVKSEGEEPTVRCSHFSL